MDKETYEGLYRRIQILENKVTPLNNAKSNPLLREIFELTQELDKIYKSHEELGVLLKLIEELELWKKLDSMDNELEAHVGVEDTINSETSRDILTHMDKIDEDSNDFKQQMVESNYAVIQDAFNNMDQFNLLEKSKLVNYLENSQEKVHDFNVDKYAIISRERALMRLAEKHYQVLIKNMIVFEKYLNTIQQENSFWLEITDTIQDITRIVAQKEKEMQFQNKY